MNVTKYHNKQLFSRFGIEAGFLPDICLVVSALMMLIARLSTNAGAEVTPLALELTVVQFFIASMCWGIRQYAVDSARISKSKYAALPRQTLLFFGVTLTTVLSALVVLFFSDQRGSSLFILLILAGNVSLFFLVALLVVETIPLSRILLLMVAMFAVASGISYIWELQTKAEIALLIISTMAVGILALAILSKRIGSQPADRRFIKFLLTNPLFLLCGPLYLFGFWLDKWIIWFFVDAYRDGADFTLLRPIANNMSGTLAALFTVPALLVAFFSFRFEIAHHYSNFTRFMLGKGTIGDINSTRNKVGRSIKIGCINTGMTQLVFSGGLIFFAAPLVELMGDSAFTETALKSSAIGNVFFVVYAFLFRTLLYFEDLRAAFWSGIGFCLGSIVFSSGMMFFNTGYGGIGLAIASIVGVVTASIPLKRRLSELDYLFFTKYQ